MTAALAPRTGLPGELLANGYILPPDLTLGEIVGIRDLAEHIVEASPWWLVDVVSTMQARFPEQYSQTLPTREDDPKGIRHSRLKQAEWMAEKWPRNTRVTGMSFTHHRIVAKLDPDERVSLLTVASAQDWSTRELAREVDARERAIPTTATGDAPVCAADRQPHLTKADLLPEHARALEGAVLDADVSDPAAFVKGAIWALQYAQCEAMFSRWED